MDMSIVAMSVSMHQNQASQDLGIAVLKMAMNSTSDMAELLDTVAESLEPELGNNIDITA